MLGSIRCTSFDDDLAHDLPVCAARAGTIGELCRAAIATAPPRQPDRMALPSQALPSAPQLTKSAEETR